MLKSHEVTARTQCLKAGGLFLKLLGIVINRLDGKSNTTLDAVHLDNTGFDFVAHFDDILHLLHMILTELRNVDESINVIFKIHKGTKAGNLGNRSFNEVAHLEAVRDFCPWIIVKLLDTEGNTLVFFVDTEHDSLHFVALLEDFGWVVDLACP